MTIGAVLDEAWTLYTRFFGRFFAPRPRRVRDREPRLRPARRGDLERLRGRSGVLGISASSRRSSARRGSRARSSTRCRTLATARSTRRSGRLRPCLAASPPALVAGLLAGLGIALGFVLFIVPGLFLLTIWAVIGPVIVIETHASADVVRPLAGARARARLDGVRDRPDHRAALRDRERRSCKRRSRSCRGFSRSCRRHHRAGRRRARSSRSRSRSCTSGCASSTMRSTAPRRRRDASTPRPSARIDAARLGGRGPRGTPHAGRGGRADADPAARPRQPQAPRSSSA